MSAPIDELLIAVRIEQGSNLMSLYEMLRDLQEAGGKIKATMPSWFSQQAWRGLLTRLDNIRDCCRSLQDLIPQTAEDIKAFIDDIINNAIAAIIDGFVMALDTDIAAHLEAYRTKLNEIDNYIKVDVMSQLSYIIEQIKNIKLEPGLFDDIEERIKSLRKLMQQYNKKITEIKNVVKNFNFDELIGDNKQLLEQIIENKEQFEPEVKEILDNLENIITSGSEGVEDNLTKQIKSVRNLMQKYGKTITTIKNLLKDIDYKDLITGNTELLNKLIENKKSFEPEVKEMLEIIEEKLKNPKINVDDLKDFISEHLKELAEVIPLDMEEFFSRVLKQVEESEINLKNLIKEQKDVTQIIQQAPLGDEPIVTISDTDFDAFTGIVEMKIKDEIEELDNRLVQIEEVINNALTYTIFEEFRRDWYYRWGTIKMKDDRLFNMEMSIIDIDRDLKEFNKKRRWQRVVKEMLDKKFPDMEERVAERVNEEITMYLDKEFNELYRILNVLTKPETMEELEGESTEKARESIRTMTSSDLFDAMETYEKEEKQRYLGGRENIELRGQDFKRTLSSINEKLDDALDSLDDINPRGDEAQRTLDDDREKAKKRRGTL